MKRLIIILIIAVGAVKASAQSMLRVHLTDNSQVNVELDGRYFNKRGTGVTVGDLPPGRHKLKIYAVDQGRRGRGYEQVIYEGKIKTTNGMISLLEFDPSTGGTEVQEQEINAYMNSQPQLEAKIQEHRQNQNNNGGSYAYGSGNNGDDGNYRGAPVSQDPPPTLTDAKIDQLKTEVSAKNTDTEKQKLLQSELQNERVSTTQIAAIMDWFGFESTKVDFAEWAYNNTVDKENFVNLENKFTYKEYQDALDKFIKSK